MKTVVNALIERQEYPVKIVGEECVVEIVGRTQICANLGNKRSGRLHC
ncbi:hypothetical protein OK016_28465 [Vibrio chagasii]|nr:hypothetical protein [Vibrio chagasii]